MGTKTEVKRTLPPRFSESAKKLEDMLRIIGFTVSESGNGANHFIINPNGNYTGWVISDEKLELRRNEEVFGAGREHYTHHGDILVRLNECEMEFFPDKPTDAMWVKSGEGISIHFRNFKR